MEEGGEWVLGSTHKQFVSSEQVDKNRKEERRELAFCWENEDG